MSDPAITLCICTYERYELLPKSIESLLRQTLPPDRYEMLVIDNSPDAARAEAFAKACAPARNLTYTHERKAGLSHARNVATRLARAPILAFMDDDAFAEPGWAQAILAAFEAFGPQTAVVGGKVVPIWAAPRPPWLHESMLGSLSVVDWGGATRIAGEKEWFAGTNVAFLVEAIRAHGGFAEALGRVGAGAALMSNEEAELLARIRAAGGAAVYAPDACVHHLVDPKRLTRAWFRRRAAWQAMSDFVAAPAASLADPQRRWENLVDYFHAMPPLARTVRGLAHETDDPDLFYWQTSIYYELATLMLSGFDGVALD
jgi:glycosyltransferase involved in cell wall biosynthesis